MPPHSAFITQQAVKGTPAERLHMNQLDSSTRCSSADKTSCHGLNLWAMMVLGSPEKISQTQNSYKSLGISIEFPQMSLINKSLSARFKKKTQKATRSHGSIISLWSTIVINWQFRACQYRWQYSSWNKLLNPRDSHIHGCILGKKRYWTRNTNTYNSLNPWQSSIIQ